MTPATEALVTIDLPVPRLASGKVRELFDLGPSLLFVATDRISAFDVIMAQGVPDKGRVLTGMSLFWFDLLSDICPNHLISAAGSDLPEKLAALPELHGRFMLVKRLEMLPVEFVVRGYLAGSGWKDYSKTGTVCGVSLPKGLKESDRLPEPIFTPSTKATEGHDQNITEEEAADLCGVDVLKRAKQSAISIYERAAGIAAERGIIVADTKFEFGLDRGEVVLADEVLTPDSSRFWPASDWVPGSSPPSFDKQPLRDWLDQQGWDHSPPPPPLPQELVNKMRERYIEAYDRITGRSFTAES